MLYEHLKLSILCFNSISPFLNHLIKNRIANFPIQIHVQKICKQCVIDHNQMKTISCFDFIFSEAICNDTKMNYTHWVPHDCPLLA